VDSPSTGNHIAFHRKINWTAAMRDMRRERVKPTAGFLAARSLEVARLDRLAKEAASAPLAVAGSYDRSANMKAAVASARAEKAKGSKTPWSQLVGFALKNIWRSAKAQRAFAMN
ncbi:MAG: hypothetical protein ACJ8DV_16325, partial [Microvirga sp.]